MANPNNNLINCAAAGSEVSRNIPALGGAGGEEMARSSIWNMYALSPSLDIYTDRGRVRREGPAGEADGLGFLFLVLAAVGLHDFLMILYNSPGTRYKQISIGP